MAKKPTDGDGPEGLDETPEQSAPPPRRSRGQKRITFNPPPPSTLPADAPDEAVKVFFAQKLQQLMLAKGWNQSDLAHHASWHAAEGVELSRAVISSYINAKNKPSPARLAALCKTFRVKPTDLLPAAGRPAAGEKDKLSMKTLDDGTAWLRINQAVPVNIAFRIMAIMGEVKREEENR